MLSQDRVKIGWEKIRQDIQKSKIKNEEHFNKMMGNIRKYNEYEKEIFKNIMDDIKKYNLKLYNEMIDPNTPEDRRVYLWFWYFMTRL